MGFIKHFFTLTFIFTVSVSAWATSGFGVDNRTQTLDDAAIEKLAIEYYLNQAQEQKTAPVIMGLLQTANFSNDCDTNEPNPSTNSCVKVLCDSNYCGGSSGQEIAKACRGSDGGCVETLCNSNYCGGSSGKEIARACRGSSGGCVKTLCESNYCGGSSGKEIAKACEGSDGGCVTELCKSTYCGGSSGKKVARTCAGE